MCGAGASAIEKERCARDEFQLYAKSRMATLDKQKAEAVKQAELVAGFKKCDKDQKDAPGKKKADKAALEKTHAACVSAQVAKVHVVLGDKKEPTEKGHDRSEGQLETEHAARVADAFEPKYEAKDPEAAVYGDDLCY